MMNSGTEQMIEAFTHRQLLQVIGNGASLGLSPITVAASMLQMAASVLVSGVSPALTSEMLRAYADCIDAGPAESPARSAAIARFMEVGNRIIATTQATRDFPAPQGRA